jgi:5-methylcytosine-specific restriction endonuclease McrA
MPLKDPEARKAYLRDYAQRNREAAYARVKEWRANNSEAVVEQARRYAAKYPEKTRAKALRWKEKNIEVIREQNRYSAAEFRKNNPDVIKERKSAYSRKNRAVINAAVARRKAAKLLRTPSWLNAVDFAEIEFTYMWCSALRECGLDYHVDHIVPLQGETVSGLHVPWNLQVLTAKENVSKRNRWSNA